MSETLHANIFFFITSVAVIALTLLWVVILWQVIAILREVRAIAKRMRKASEDIEHDLELLRASVRAGGQRVRSLGSVTFDFLLRMLTSNPRRSAPRRPKSPTRDSDIESEENS